MPMSIFISWSLPTSERIATALHDWLPQVIQDVQPWMSAEDIEKGTRPMNEIAQQLKKGQFGIACLTPDNRESIWIHWEAGALAKDLEQSRLYTFLFGLTPSQVKGPLEQFQHTRAMEKEDTYKMVKAINKAHPGRMIEEPRLRRTFDMFWPELHKTLEEIRKQPTTAASPPPRKTEDMIQEILEISRGMVQRQGSLDSAVQIIIQRLFPTGAAEPNSVDALLRAIQAYQDPTIVATRSIFADPANERRFVETWRAFKAAEGGGPGIS